MKKLLEEIRSGARSAEALTLTLRDLSEFHGDGADITVAGLELSAVEQRGDEAVRWHKHLSEDELHRLVDLLIELELWRQDVLEDVALPDETRATLTLTVGGSSSAVWEWHDGLRRLAKLEAVLTAIAPRPGFEPLPRAEEITDVELVVQPDRPVTKVAFLQAWAGVRALTDADPVLETHDYLPWFAGTLKTKARTLSFEVCLGGLGKLAGAGPNRFFLLDVAELEKLPP